MSTPIAKGDRINAYGLVFSVDKILYQDHYGDMPPAPGSDMWGYDVEFIDDRGAYHHWKQNQDGGTASRLSGRSWSPLSPDCTRFRGILFKALGRISEYHPDCAPVRGDDLARLVEKYFFWVTEYNDGHIPTENYSEPFSGWIRDMYKRYTW